MLQQTQVVRVLPKFAHFIARWPTIDALSQAKLSEVLTEWQGLGYNRRAKHLLETAKIVTQTNNGVFPVTQKELLALPGFGPYMVSALRVFAFGTQDAVIDVNISRVLSRVETGLRPVSTKEIQEIAEQNIPKNRADEWHQMLMDFGSLICKAKAPKCDECPVARLCLANREAKSLGFSDFASWLSVQLKVKTQSKKDIGKKFEETDRYFRGRIIDLLRSGDRPMEHVWEHLSVVHSLDNRVRFGRLIEGLVVDGLIKIQGNSVSLA